jgi:23S rRNA (uracil1939-C5)-methyltransferase
MKKGDWLENLEIVDISSDGKSVGKHDGWVIFLAGGVPGDRVNARVTYRRRKRIEARIEEIVQASPHRVEPFCPHFGTCGGCKWQQFSYQGQLQFKERHVAENLAKITGSLLPEIRPILGSKNIRYYRNKLEYTFSNKRWLLPEELEKEETLDRRGLGFHIPGRFDKVLDIEICYHQKDPSNAIRKAFRAAAVEADLSFFDLREQHGLLRNLIIRTSTTGQVMVILQCFEPKVSDIEALLEKVSHAFPEVTSWNYIINQKKNESYHDQDVVCFRGQPYIEERMGDLTFRISPKSFYQTHSEQAEVLYDLVKQLADFSGSERVFDLYTGTGTIANYIARDVKEVIGIEYVKEAIADARVNAEINDINNTRFYAGDMKEVLSETFIEKHGPPDVVITDPPRAGMHEEVLKVIISMAPRKIVYVSCNPATQARDLQSLLSHYDVRHIQPVDMFPHTQHVENVVLLELRN